MALYRCGIGGAEPAPTSLVVSGYVKLLDTGGAAAQNYNFSFTVYPGYTGSASPYTYSYKGGGAIQATVYITSVTAATRNANEVTIDEAYAKALADAESHNS